MAMSAAVTSDSLGYYLTTGSVSTRPTGWLLSLHTANPGVNGSTAEVTGSGYARQSITFTKNTTDPNVPFASNSNLVTFPTATAAYTVTHIVVRDQAGNPLVIQQLVDPKTIDIGAQASLAVGELIIGKT